jgi:hypothetical protein
MLQIKLEKMYIKETSTPTTVSLSKRCRFVQNGTKELVCLVAAGAAVVGVGVAIGAFGVQVAQASNDGVKCFSGDSTVTLLDGSRKRIGLLHPRDRILTMDEYDNIVETETVIILDRNPHQSSKTITSFFLCVNKSVCFLCLFVSLFSSISHN